MVSNCTNHHLASPCDNNPGGCMAGSPAVTTTAAKGIGFIRMTGPGVQCFGPTDDINSPYVDSRDLHRRHSSGCKQCQARAATIQDPDPLDGNTSGSLALQHPERVG